MGIAAGAEGVETESPAARLKGLGCQIAQGLYFSEPLRAEEFNDLLTRHFAPMRCAAPGAAGPAAAGAAELATADLAGVAVSAAR